MSATKTDPADRPLSVQIFGSKADEMADAALGVLNKNKNGFVLMIEGAHIDKQSHAMDAERAIWDTIEFDNAVQKCLDFANKVGDTMVIVTADHECSGFSIIGALAKSTATVKALPSDAGVLDPNVQPEHQKVVGVYDAAGFPKYVIAPDGYPVDPDPDGKLLIGYGGNADRYEDWLSEPYPIIDSLLPNDIKAEMANGTTATGGKYPANPINRAAESANGFFLRGQAGTGQAVHTASDVALSAYSSSSRAWQMFIGVQDNTDVFFKLASAALGGY